MKKVTVSLSLLVLLLIIGVFIVGCGDDPATNEDESSIPSEDAIEEDEEVTNEEDESADGESISPADHVYSEDNDDEDDPDPIVYSKETLTTDQDQQVSGEVNLAAGASIMIGTEPASGSASVDDTGIWDYTPDAGFIGEDLFTLIFDRNDGREEIKTIQVRVQAVDEELDEVEQDNETEQDEDEQDEMDQDDEELDEDDETLPGAGGITAIASLVALWLFILATFCLRKGVLIK